MFKGKNSIMPVAAIRLPVCCGAAWFR